MMIDCRDVPSESGCTLVIAGEPDEVLRAAVGHAVEVHGHTDGPELREGITAGMRPASGELTSPGAFVQLIEFRTARIEDFDEEGRKWAEAIGAEKSARWELTCADRDDPGRYVQVVAFPDHASAMANSAHPATSAAAERMTKICEDVGFRNLDVHAVEQY
jgi:hypothetical protein